jgi:hypothetical protein
MWKIFIIHFKVTFRVTLEVLLEVKVIRNEKFNNLVNIHIYFFHIFLSLILSPFFKYNDFKPFSLVVHRDYF